MKYAISVYYNVYYKYKQLGIYYHVIYDYHVIKIVDYRILQKIRMDIYKKLLQADDSPTSDVLFMDNTGNLSESEIRHRNVEPIPAENADRQQSEIILNHVETMSSSNDLFWSILIASLVSAIILLILRRLFLV